MTSSSKLSSAGTALNKTEPQIKQCQTTTIGPQSPSKKSLHRDLENLPPYSPDLLSVPETPNSQNRPAFSSSSSSDPSQLNPLRSKEETDLEKLGQRSSICRSPRSKKQSVWRAKTEESGGIKKDERFPGPQKRLFSPPQESVNAKRLKSANSPVHIRPLSPNGNKLNIARPVIGSPKTLLLSNNQSEDQKKHQEQKDPNKKDSCFTVITEQKTAEKKADKNPHTLLQAGAPTITNTTKRNVKGADVNVNNKQDETSFGNTEAAITSNGDCNRVTPSDQQPAGGTVDVCVNYRNDLNMSNIQEATEEINYVYHHFVHNKEFDTFFLLLPL